MDKISFNLKLFVDKIVHGQEDIFNALQHKIDEDDHEKKIMNFFFMINNSHFFFNSAISKKIADYLQLLKEEDNYKQVSLEKIKEIYEGLIKIHPMDISLYESFAWYLDSVMDSPEQATAILRKGIGEIEKKIGNLKEDMKNLKLN